MEESQNTTTRASGCIIAGWLGGNRPILGATTQTEVGITVKVSSLLSNCIVLKYAI